MDGPELSAALAATSGTPRIALSPRFAARHVPFAGWTWTFAWVFCRLKYPLTPPPVATEPPNARSFHATSSRVAFASLGASIRVPPQASTEGLEAGKFTLGIDFTPGCTGVFTLPRSPDEQQIATPARRAAISVCSIICRALGPKTASDSPHEIEITVGAGSLLPT